MISGEGQGLGTKRPGNKGLEETRPKTVVSREAPSPRSHWAPRPAEQLQEAFLPSRAWLVLRLLESLVKCVMAPRQPAPRGGVHLPVPAQDRTRVALLWAGAEAETPTLPQGLSRQLPEAWPSHILSTRTPCAAGLDGASVNGNPCLSLPTSWGRVGATSFHMVTPCLWPQGRPGF